MAKESSYAYNWGAGADGANSGVWVGVAGAALPTSASGVIATGASGFGEVGWLSSDGITESHGMDSNPVNAWQGGSQIKILKNNETRSFKFQALEENAVVMGLLRPGSTVSTAGNVTTTRVKSATGSNRLPFVIDLIADASTKKRICIDSGEVSEFADVVYTDSALTVYEFTVSVYVQSDGGFYTEYSTAPGVAVS